MKRSTKAARALTLELLPEQQHRLVRHYFFPGVLFSLGGRGSNHVAVCASTRRCSLAMHRRRPVSLSLASGTARRSVESLHGAVTSESFVKERRLKDARRPLDDVASRKFERTSGRYVAAVYSGLTN